MHAFKIRAALIVADCAFLGFVLCMEDDLNTQATEAASTDFLGMLLTQFGCAAMPASLAPLSLQSHEKIPLNRGSWAGGATFHLLLSFAVMIVYYVRRICAYTTNVS